MLFKITANTRVTLLISSQLLLLVAALAEFISRDTSSVGGIFTHLLLLAFFAISIVVCIFASGRILGLYKREALLAARGAMAESFATLADSMQEQNQGFLRQVEEMSQLVQNRSWDRLGLLLESIVGQARCLNTALKVDNPIIGALLRAKATEAQIKQITFDTDISASLAQMTVCALDLARILNNLIDNAFDAVLNMSKEERIVSLVIRRAGPLLQLEVGNHGVSIDGQAMNDLFKAGFTTKGKDHSGLGLHIVKTLTEKLSGAVKVLSDEADGIRFIVSLPGKY
jgi:sensor histidine kinase regulating citrate/malate metabolism